MKSFIKEADYVCEPSSISIKLHYRPQLGGVKLIFYIDNKPAIERHYRLPAVTDRREYDLFVKHMCDMFFKWVPLDEFTDRLTAAEYLKGEYIYKFLEKVMTKTGTTVWSKN